MVAVLSLDETPGLETRGEEDTLSTRLSNSIGETVRHTFNGNLGVVNA